MELTISMASTSAVAPEADYSWNTYTSAASFGLLFRGKEVLISKDKQFGLRDGSKGAARLILRGEPTKVITVTPEERTVILARATPFVAKNGKKAKVQGVVPEFDAAAFWKSDISPAIGEALTKFAGARPTRQMSEYMKDVATAVKNYGEGKPTDALGAKVLAALNKPVQFDMGSIDDSRPMGRLAIQLTTSSPELKRIFSGNVKHKKLADFYSTYQDFYYGAAHAMLAAAMLTNRQNNIINTAQGFSSSITRSIPAKVMSVVDDMHRKAATKAR